jgi:aspartate aminotransferase
VWVITDEIYQHLTYDGVAFTSVLQVVPELADTTVVLNGVAKTYAMTGWRLGYAVAQEPFMTGLRKLVLYSTNGVSTPVQWAGLAALAEPGFERGERLEQYRRRRELLVEGLNGVGLACEPPAGAFYAFPSVAAIDADSRRAAEILLERAQIATIPGAVFGPHGEGHVRFSYATSIETIEAGMRALRQMFG